MEEQKIDDVIATLLKMKEKYGNMRVLTLQYKDNGKTLGYFDARKPNKKSEFYISKEGKHIECIVL